MSVNLLGATFDLYVGNSNDYDGIFDAFRESKKIGPIDLIFSKYGTGNFQTTPGYLYEFDSITNSSIFVPDTAKKLDSLSPNWMYQTLFYKGSKTYTGKVPINNLLSLFPYKYDIDDYDGNIFYFTRDDMDSVAWFGYIYDSLNWDGFFSKRTMKALSAGAPLSRCIFTTQIGGYVNFLTSSYERNDRAINANALGYSIKHDSAQIFGDTYGIALPSDFSGTLTDNFIPNNDPYKKGGSTSIGGGNGTFGGGSTIFGGNTDSIDIPDLPSLSAVDTGFITLFTPTLAQLNSLASYMWSDVFSLDTFKKLYSDPMDCILGLSIVPVQPTSGDTGPVKIGNISTDVTMNKASSQYVSVDCGTVEVKEYWGGYLDYSPYTKCEIYLPYVGVHEISVDDIMNKSVHIVYHVDILSGACNAYVKCGDSVLYTFIGQCSSSIPISGNDWTNTINGVLSIAGNIGSLVASGGASAPTELPSMAQNAVNALKPNIEKSGAMSGTGGMLGIQKPYIILTRPNQALPENQNKYTGYPSFITMNLSECSGYTEIETIRLENMTCTDDELTEIEALLKQGVVF